MMSHSDSQLFNFHVYGPGWGLQFLIAFHYHALATAESYQCPVIPNARVAWR